MNRFVTWSMPSLVESHRRTTKSPSSTVIEYMISYMVGKLAPNLSHLTRGLVKYVPGRGYFRAVPSQNGDTYVTSPPPPPNRLTGLSHDVNMGTHPSILL